MLKNNNKKLKKEFNLLIKEIKDVRREEQFLNRLEKAVKDCK